MNASRFAIGLVGLALTGLWYFAGGAQPVPAPIGAGTPQLVAAPLAHENLSVYFIHGGDAVPDARVLTLQEALDRNLAVVHETSNVNVLAVENRSPDAELFIQSGDIVKGGRQDRMAATDMLVPPGSGVVALPAHCVEHDRWTGRGAEDARRFASSNQCAAGKEVKYANLSFNQPGSWAGVKSFADKLSASLGVPVAADASPSSFQLVLESPVLRARVAEFESALKGAGEDRDDIIGAVFVVNGQVSSAEVYGSNTLFRKAWPKLLSAAAVEAIAERTDKVTAAPPSPREVERYLAYGADNEPAASVPTPPGQGGSAQPLSPYLNLAGHAPVNDSSWVRPSAINPNEELDLHLEATTAAPQLSKPLPTGGVSGIVFTTGGTAPRPSFALKVESFDNLGAPGSPSLSTPAPVPPAPPANSGGNRLSSNRLENNSTLMVESLDPARKNVVIHRSYLAAPATGGDNGRGWAAAQPALPAAPAVQVLR